MFFQSSDGYTVLRLSNSEDHLIIELGDPKAQKNENVSLKVDLDLSQAWNLHKALAEFLNIEGGPDAEANASAEPLKAPWWRFFTFKRP